ncbi:MAG: hypothetical protein F4103_16460 [Boseongicola sp. SB0673_bin_14]|nr:hypothetical protein [Boseongicola sp. SB0673_bin_14]
MSLHAELLKQARFLARKERKKPTQASLRRSVSASYYAIFHFLVDEATRLMLAGNVRAPLRDSLARAFHHSAMKQAAVAFAKGSIPLRLASGLNGQQVQQPLIDVASAFVQLQEARHEADYNRGLRFTRRETLDLADLAEQAFGDWRQVRGSLPADAFLTGLLVYRHMHG